MNKSSLIFAALVASLSVPAIASDAPKKESKVKTTVTKQAKKPEAPKAPPSAVKPTPKKKAEGKDTK